jgi:3-deoxy-D-manno-octulosonic-acid transferase
MIFYNLLISIGIVIASPVLFWLGWVKGHRVRERMGIYNGRVKKFLKGRKPIWFHAASVGEVRVLAALISAYIRTSHEKKIIVSTVTRTGRQTAEKILPKECLAIYAPLDLDLFVKRAFRMINPRALVLAETEFWPNMIQEACKRNVRIFCINGRISKRSYPRYRLAKPFVKKLLGKIEFFFMQGHGDADRAVNLGVDRSKILVTGNIKHDLHQTDVRLKKAFKISQRPEWLGQTRVLVAGSTHQGEERIILSAYSKLKKKHDGLLLILAPRHTGRAEEVSALVRNEGMDVFYRSQFDRRRNNNTTVNPGAVLILDTMGELQYVYNWGEAAFVGGSLDNTGGHNPLEPAAFSKPIAFGPNMQNCQEISRFLLESGGARTVHNADDLYDFFDRILSDPEERRKTGINSGLAAHKNNGISRIVAEELFDYIAHPQKTSGQVECSSPAPGLTGKTD